MDFNKVCYGCFRETESPVCPYCGYVRGEPDRPFIALPAGAGLNGRYLIGKVLGVGGFGVTYLGYDLTLEIKVAIKEYLPNGVATRASDRYSMTLVSPGAEPQYRQGTDKFLEEARTLAKLSETPNIVSVLNYFRENNTAYFVMNYIEGRSLKRVVEERGGRLPFDEALGYLLPVMQALVQVHAHNLLHRDISPDNIYITDAGQSRLLDFGAARAAAGAESRSVVLKHGYAPEEQYSTRGNQGTWTDVYAMSATLYHVITGILPPDSIDRLHEDTLMPPSQLGCALPPYADDAIWYGMAVQPNDRIQSMESLISALNGQTNGYGGSANALPGDAPQQPAPVDYQNAYAAPQTVYQPAGSAPQPVYAAEPLPLVKRKTQPWLIVLIVGAGLFVVAAVVLLIVSLGGSCTPKLPDNGGEDGVSFTSQSTPSKSEASSSEPEPTEGFTVPTTTYSDDSYMYSIEVPETYTSTENDYTTSYELDDTVMIHVGQFWRANWPFYDVQDVYKRADIILERIVSEFQADDFNIFNAEYVDEIGVNDAKFFVNYEFDGVPYEGYVYATDTSNLTGCYLLFYMHRSDDPDFDENEQNAMACLHSFRVLGDIESDYLLYSNDSRSVRFLYDPALVADTKVDGNRVSLYSYSDSTFTEVYAQYLGNLPEATLEDTFDARIRSLENAFNTTVASTEDVTEEVAQGTWSGLECTLVDTNTIYRGMLFLEIDGEWYEVGYWCYEDEYDEVMEQVNNLTQSFLPR